ncbi:hypothetical protein NC651_010158 [Populus alba x Populus x berolinensis]|nr:hypothetical protein NC651_010158 [Populus alba x Populus x berolinensis]
MKSWKSTLEGVIFKIKFFLFPFGLQFGKQLEENIQTSASSSRLTFSSKARALPAPSSEPSTPASIGSQEVQRPPRNAASPSSQQRSNGISGVVELASGLRISKGIHTEEETSNRTSWLKPAFLMRTRSATNSAMQQILVDPQYHGSMIVSFVVFFFF